MTEWIKLLAALTDSQSLSHRTHMIEEKQFPWIVLWHLQPLRDTYITTQINTHIHNKLIYVISITAYLLRPEKTS